MFLIFQQVNIFGVFQLLSVHFLALCGNFQLLNFNLWQMMGNFHPLLVHLPIGIFLFGFALECFSRFKKIPLPQQISAFTLATAAGFALFSVISGLLLAQDGAYNQDNLSLHRNMGIAFTLGAFGLLFIQQYKAVWTTKAFLPLYAILVLLLSITGHYGGNMTHGEGFLFGQNDSSSSLSIASLENTMVYNDLVKPVLDLKCVACHNEKKTEGGLLMTSPEWLLKGGEHGPIFPTNKDTLGTLLTRVHLPLEEKEHMPPKSKKQLSSQEIVLLEWWIQNKACFDCSTANLEANEKVALALQSFLEDNSPIKQWEKTIDPVPQDWILALASKGITAYPITFGHPMVIVNARGKQNLTKKDFKLLKKYQENIVEINLGASNMNDTLAVFLKNFEHLLKLQIPQTPITDKGMEYVKSLDHLLTINAFATNVTSKSLDIISEINTLENAYLADTQINKNTMEAFVAKNGKLRLHYISEDTFAQTALDPPTILSKTDFFRDSLAIEMAYVFENASLFYTLDGSTPDSTSIKYNRPFSIDKTTVLKAVTYMEGWGLSAVAEADFKKSNIDYSKVELLEIPNEKYTANGGKSLVDLKRGSTNFVDGMWLGFEGKNSEAILTLSKSEKVNSMAVGTLSAPASWIFYPIGLEIFSSNNGIDYKKIAQQSYSPEEPNNDVKKKFLEISFPEVAATHLKVVVKSPLKNPEWHPNPGGKSWIFIDEIIVD